MTLPAEGLSLADMQATNKLLLASGAAIHGASTPRFAMLLIETL